MGKETKIGLAVLAALLIALGVVVYKRLSRPSDETAVAAAEAGERASSPANRDTPGDDWKSTNANATVSKPMVLSPAKTPGGAAARSPEDVTSQWITATDPPKKGSSGDATVASDLPPGGIPGPPAPTADDHYTSSSDARPASSPSPAVRAEASVLAPAKQAADPLPGRADRYAPAAAAASPLATEGASTTRTAEPPPSYSSASHDSYSAASPPPAYPPASHDSYATASPPPAYPQAASPPSAYSPPTYAAASPTYGQSARDSFHAASPPPAYSPPPRDSYAAAAAPPSYPDARGTYGRSAPPPLGDAESFSHAGGTYEVQPNDNYWLISQKVYGSGAYFKALAEHNRGKVPERDKLRVGDSISTPTIAQLEQTYPELCPKPSRRETVRNRATLASSHGGYGGGRTYEVQEGDTLFDIARNELGKATRWAEIYQLNRDALGKDFDYLTPGMQLTLPPKDAPASPDKTTRRPGPVYDR